MSATGQPCTAADITPSWVLDVAGALRLEGQAVRPSACGLRIEVQSINTGEWHALALPTLAGRFTDRATRDAVLACIEAEVRGGAMAREAAAKGGRPAPVCRECDGHGYTRNLSGVTRDCDCVRRAARA